MKKSVLLMCLSAASFSFAQNTWDGSTISTVTTTGNVGIGALASNSSKLRVSSSANTITTNLNASISNTLIGTQYGIYNTSSFLGSGTKYGIYNTLSSATSNDEFGIYNTVSGTGNNARYGMFTNMTGGGTGAKYGLSINVAAGTAATDEAKYGVSVNMNTSGAGDKRYGIYSVATGAGGKAGYFQGDVENRGNVVFTTNNQSRFLLHTSWMSDPVMTNQFLQIVPNNTSGQDDWDFENSTAFYNSGLVEKRTNTNDKAFSIRNRTINLPNSTTNDGTDVFRIYGDGRVYATELNVRLMENFPDYVFLPQYKLMPLNEVRTYIQVNGHLPNIPAASIIEEEGMNVGEMTRTLVEKVEELTLYVLQQQAEIEALKKELGDSKTEK